MKQRTAEPLDADETVGGLLATAAGGAVRHAIPAHMHGFGGPHGGLVAALTASAMRSVTEPLPLRRLTVQYLRPARNELAVSASAIRAGQRASFVIGSVVGGGRRVVNASATFAVARRRGAMRSRGPELPSIPAAEACERVDVPVEFVPFVQHTEIRAAGEARPFGGGSEPELIAWIRLIGDDHPPDELRLITLVDALAPSWSAVLQDPVDMPTVELTVQPDSEALAAASSPWIAVRSRTSQLSGDGWFSEQIDTWTPEGRHLATAHQLRLIADQDEPPDHPRPHRHRSRP